MKNIKRVLAVVLGTTMVFGSSLTAFASAPVQGVDASTAGTGQVLDFKKVSQVVPTALKVAINPNGYAVNLRYKAAKGTEYSGTEKYYTLSSEGVYSVAAASAVTKDGDGKITADVYTADTSVDQIVTFNYGLANKSTVARKITVKLDVTADENITFVDSADAARSKTDSDPGTAERGEYKVYLELIPAKASTTPTTSTYAKATAYADNTTYYTRGDDNKYTAAASVTADNFASGTYYVATTAIGTEIQSSELGDITMTESEDAISFASGAGTTSGDVAFSLPKATWALKADQYLDLDTAAADVASKFEMTAVGGVSGFTISGTMNKNAEWSLLTTKTITITPTYVIADATGEEVAVDTGLNQIKAEARVPASAAPSISTTDYTLAADTPVVITANFGTGDEKATAITGVLKSDDTELADTNYTIEGNTITMNAAWVNKIMAKMETGDSNVYKIVFNDSDETKISVTFTK